MNIRLATIEDAAAIARVRIDTWRTTYRHIVPEAFLAAMSYEKGEASWTEHLKHPKVKSYIFVAQNDEHQIVGFVAGGTNRDHDPIYEAELYAIYILQEYHGQGIGRQLTTALVDKLLAVGLESMLLWVFKTNPARRFYEALGGQLLRSSQFEIAGTTVEEVAYGWLDIGIILRKS